VTGAVRPPAAQRRQSRRELTRADKPPRNVSIDTRNLFADVHHDVTAELLRLLDGFYSNIEDGLFELAYRTGEESQRRRCFDLMRELRFRRAGLVKNFARAMDRHQEGWIDVPAHSAALGIGQELETLVLKMAEKTSAHFSGVLGAIAERAEMAGARRFASPADLPISPQRVAQAFVHSCRSLRLDHDSIVIVQELFSRFVLDSLGSTYGACNLRLKEEGCLTADEMNVASAS
jgi:hypothetical protein